MRPNWTLGRLNRLGDFEADAGPDTGLVGVVEGLEARTVEGVVDAGLEAQLAGWVEAGPDAGQLE